MQIAKDHVSYIITLIDEQNRCVLGRTTNIYKPELFRIVIFDAANIEKANEISQNVPFICNQIKDGTIRPFHIVFVNYKKKD